MACRREVGEETGLAVRVVRLVGRVERDGPGGVVYEIDDFLCAVEDDGTAVDPRAGDDAVDARWVTRVELTTLPLAASLYTTLSGWGCLPD